MRASGDASSLRTNALRYVFEMFFVHALPACCRTIEWYMGVLRLHLAVSCICHQTHPQQTAGQARSGGQKSQQVNGPGTLHCGQGCVIYFARILPGQSQPWDPCIAADCATPNQPTSFPSFRPRHDRAVRPSWWRAGSRWSRWSRHGLWGHDATTSRRPTMGSSTLGTWWSWWPASTCDIRRYRAS